MKELLVRFLYWLLDLLEEDAWTEGVGTVLEPHDGTKGWIERWEGKSGLVITTEEGKPGATITVEDSK